MTLASHRHVGAERRGKRPLWLGEFPLARKTILLHAEQGLGDTILFARYAPLLAARGAKVVLEVQPELKSLMARLDGARAVIARGEKPSPFDVHCPLGSLPLALKTGAWDGAGANSLSYRRRCASRQMVGAGRRAARGRGSPSCGPAMPATTTTATARSRFARLAPLFDERPASFISIQRDVRSEDAQALAARLASRMIGDELEDFSDTAAVLALCDLVITVDTAAAHLAGAMGRPVWVLVPSASDWRWTRGATPRPGIRARGCSGRRRSAIGIQ